MEEHGIGTYPVGVMEVILRRGRGWRSSARYLRHQIERRNWRAVRSHFNGYLAEWHYPPNDPSFVHAGKCGRGWTRKAALRRLGQNIVAANLSDQERAR